MELPETALSRLIDPLLIRIGQVTGYLWVLLLAIIVINVVLRYAFGEGRIEFEEIQWHLYATGFLLALGYAVGRIGCFLVGDDFGMPTTLPWGVKFPAGVPAVD